MGTGSGPSRRGGSGVARSQQARIAVWGAALIASTAVVLWLARLLNRNSKLAGVAGMAVGLASLALSFWQLGLALRQRHANEPSAAGRSGVGNDILEQAARHLVGRIQTQWKHQENRRRVRDPYPLAVRWHTSEELRDHWVNIRRSPPGAVAGPLALDGRLEHITAVYRRIPSGRLVILGKPGAG